LGMMNELQSKEEHIKNYRPQVCFCIFNPFIQCMDNAKQNSKMPQLNTFRQRSF
jgi:hypothetical protein